ncbi:MAG: class I tRNA ligase family protein [archaeon]
MANWNEIEGKWQKKWEENKSFKVSDDHKKKKYYCLEMFPYPSGSGLHMGHALNYTIGDVHARFMRMNGNNVLYPMGYDAFGLPAENAAIKAGEHPKSYTENSIKNFIMQQKALGISYDWDRLVVTCKPDYYKWNQYFFLKFVELGLVYRKKSAVNWCPKCNTVLANEQVHSGKCWRHEDTDVIIKQLEQWFIKTTEYADELLDFIPQLKWPQRIKIMQENWIGKSYGTEIAFEINGEKWTIFTTRPDTIFGVTFMVISAQHPRLMELVIKEQKKEVDMFLKKIKSTTMKNASNEEMNLLEKEGVFTGSYAKNPLSGEKIPVYAGNFVVAEYGGGMVMGVPAHDERDFAFAIKYNIPLKKVIDIDSEMHLVVSKKEVDIGFFEKIRKIEIYIEERESDYAIVADSKNAHQVIEILKAHLKSDVSRAFADGTISGIITKKGITSKIDELNYKFCYAKKGKLVNSGKFNGLSSEDAIEKISEHIEKHKYGKKVVQYKLRDWLISRQRYWGTPIPMVYCEKCGIVPVPENELPVILPEDVKFGVGNPLATNKKFVDCKCPKCKGSAKRETDTMDTFFDSSWYFLRYADSKNEIEPFDVKKCKYWMPVDQYIGGAEHACMHLIYARFFVKALRDMGMLSCDEPFTRLFNQGMLHGADGNKMSKSLGNVINPIEIIEKYSADSLRFNLMSLASPDSDSVWSDRGMESSFKYISKIFSFFEKIKIGKSSAKIESKLNRIIKEYTELIAAFKYNLGIIKLRELFDELEKEEEISIDTAQKFIQLLHPFCPHITEELWEKLGGKGMVSLSSWPVYDEAKIDLKAEAEDLLFENTMSDINVVLKLSGIAQPKNITLIVSPEWKYDLFAQLKIMLDETRNTGEIIKRLMSTDLRKYGGDITKIVPKVIQDPSKIPSGITSQDEEYNVLLAAKEKLESSLKTNIIIEIAEKSAEKKAGQAMPGKPAIVVG